MSKGMKLWIAITTVLFFPSNAIAYSDSVEFRSASIEFKRLRLGEPQENLNAHDIGMFIGYMTGVNQMMFFNTEFGVCFPKTGGSNGQYADVVIQYLEKNSNLLHKPPLYLVVRAYQEAFPCE